MQAGDRPIVGEKQKETVNDADNTPAAKRARTDVTNKDQKPILPRCLVPRPHSSSRRMDLTSFDDLPNEILAMMAKLALCSPRYWQKYWTVWSQLAHRVAGLNLTALESFSIELPPSSRSPFDAEEPQNSVSVPPLLTWMSLANTPTLWGGTLVIGDLTHLQLEGLDICFHIPWSKVVATLVAARCLEMLELIHFEPVDIGTLQLVLHSVSTAILVLSRLDLPKLKTFDLTVWGTCSTEPVINACLPILMATEHLTLSVAHTFSSKIVRLMNALPNLRTLDVRPTSYLVTGALLKLFQAKTIQFDVWQEICTSRCLPIETVHALLTPNRKLLSQVEEGRGPKEECNGPVQHGLGLGSTKSNSIYYCQWRMEGGFIQ
ncbi:hypothetical protein DFH07DRAFT_768615 [Mycena maculata]|uniref:Uncharacterized protein n=1 Tax=Mycena maculata TaxID=230809 RepID=A0AAD7JV01_9AGAR|nr:hypothetical protein DFH07DRAFT_768615 [Mycena maculata]